MFKTEMHCHSTEVSACAAAHSDYIVERYIEEGYRTIVLTNHFNKSTFKNKQFDHSADPWEKKVDHFLYGYYRLKEVAAGRLNILLGMELRFEGENNDYLVYGLTDRFLFEHPEMPTSNIKDFSPVIRNAGMLLIQAHPFRNKMKVTEPSLLDGIEVFNGNAKHDSRNDIARLWAEKYDMITTSGTDFHRDRAIVKCGISTESEICTNEQLLNALKGRNFKLLINEDIAF